MSIIIPLLSFGTYYNECNSLMVDLFAGLAILSFFLDRMGIAVTHPLWHVFGGISITILQYNMGKCLNDYSYWRSFDFDTREANYWSIISILQ